MSLQSRLDALISAIGADVKQMKLDIAAGGGGGGVAGTKISALPSSTSIDGTELVPVVQGGVTESVASALLQPWREQRLTSTYVNATVTGSDVFTGFTPVANTRYLVDVLASVQSNIATSGVQTALSGPTTGITRSGVKIISAATSSTDMITHTVLNTYQAATNGLTTPSLISVQAIIEVGASPGAGNIRFQARTEVAATNAVQIFPGSTMRWRVI